MALFLKLKFCLIVPSLQIRFTSWWCIYSWPIGLDWHHCLCPFSSALQGGRPFACPTDSPPHGSRLCSANQRHLKVMQKVKGKVKLLSSILTVGRSLGSRFQPLGALSWESLTVGHPTASPQPWCLVGSGAHMAAPLTPASLVLLRAGKSSGRRDF